ncbi:MAG: sugar transferase [Chloroflexota bacterium]
MTESHTKRVFDLVVASVSLILLAPVCLAICAAIAVESGWSPLYSQRRTGLNGRDFRIWKFRTMVRNAEAMKAELLALNEAPFPAFKLRNDPRVTRLGRFLRKSSLDELPQLWNVIRGDMSLVGPRPLPVAEAARVSAAGKARLLARPGITCIWQVTNRHSANDSFDDWVAKDLAYIDNWSFWLDLVLLWRSAGAVLRMTGR